MRVDVVLCVVDCLFSTTERLNKEEERVKREGSESRCCVVCGGLFVFDN